MVYLANAFSLNMLTVDDWGANVHIGRPTGAEVRNLIKGGFVSAVGHADTAKLLSDILETVVAFNRINVTLRPGVDTLVVAQYQGPRLEEGTTRLPMGAGFRFYSVTYERVTPKPTFDPGHVDDDILGFSE